MRDNLCKRLFWGIWCLFFLAPGLLFAQDTGGMPPALVVVAGVSEGTVAPQMSWVGTVKYFKTAEVAAEVSGKVESRSFEAGSRVAKGEILLEIDASMHRQELEAQKALLRQAEAELEKARLNFKRIESLFQKSTVPEQVYDENRLEVRSLENKLAFHAAEVKRLSIELEKRSLRAPFSGVVLDRKIEVGEWLSVGSAVCAMADDSEVDVVAMVPDSSLRNIQVGEQISVHVNGEELQGTLFAVLARGDIKTRTFPVKVRLQNRGQLLLDGMEAKVNLPSGQPQQSLMVHRDAVLGQGGKQVIFAVENNMAKMMEVEVLGYQGLLVGVRAAGLTTESKVVVKGNERLQDGQPVNISSSSP